MPENKYSLYDYLMQNFDSISHFLKSGGFNYQIFDMSRKVTPLDADYFEKIENQQAVYPYPFKRQAHFALLLWSKDKDPVIWFLQFPVDELGYLKQDARDSFLLGLLEQAGRNILAKKKGDSILDQLQESPFAYKPTQDKLAFINAMAKKKLGLPPSRFYPIVHDYVSGKIDLDQWQFLGLQGIADLVANLDKDNNESLLISVIPEMPNTSCVSFCNLLENIPISDELADAIYARLQKELGSRPLDMQLISMLIRALSGAQNNTLKKQALRNVLASPVGGNVEILAAIAGRSWESLKDEELMVLFLNRLAEQDQNTFNVVMEDLLRMPGLREVVMATLDGTLLGSDAKRRLNDFLKTVKADR